MNNNHYKIEIFNNKRYITFPILNKYKVANCMSTIDSFAKGNPMDVIYLNEYDQLSEFLNSKNKQRFFSNQVHGNNVEIISAENLGIEFELGNVFPNSDGLISDFSGLLLTKYADCTPVIIFDTKKRVLATIHSGWKGTVLKISQKAIELMIHKFKCDLKDIIVVIGPNIGYEDFEVKEDVFNEFKSTFGNTLDHFSKIKGKKHYLIDIAALIKNDFLELGVLEENLYTCDLSTYSTEFLHSYRRDKNHSGRMVLACSV